MVETILTDRNAASSLLGRHALVIFVVALIVRLVNLAFTPLQADALLLADAAMYWHEAEILLETGRFLADAGVTNTERVPYYHVFLALIQALFGAHFLPVLLAQQLLDSATCVLIALLARALDGRMFLTAGILAALWPNLWIHSAQILTDTLFLFFFSAGIWALLRLLQTGWSRFALIAGLALGAATMTRPVTQFMILLLVLTLPILLRALQRKWGVALRSALLFVVAAAAPLAPHLVRNAVQFDSIALTSQNGTHVLNWVLPNIIIREGAVTRQEAIAVMGRHLQEYARQRGIQDPDILPPFARSQLYVAAAFDKLHQLAPAAIAKAWLAGMATNLMVPSAFVDNRIVRMPRPSLVADTSGNWADRLTTFVRISPPGYLVFWVVCVAGAAIATALQLGGLALHLRTQAFWALLGLAVVLYFLLINGPVTSPKYRLPMEPILIIWTSHALHTGLDLLRRRRAAAHAPEQHRSSGDT